MGINGRRTIPGLVALAMSVPPSHAEAQRITSVGDLRAAIDRASPNSTVSVPPGTYNIGSTPIRIENKRNVRIAGAGAGRTIIRSSASAPFIFELAGSNYGLSVADMTLEGSSRLARNTHGLASGSDRMNLTRARFHGLEIRNVAVGISVVGSGNGICRDVQITSNRLENIQDFTAPDGTTSGSGYGIHNDGCTNVRIADNEIRNADRHSIYQASAYQPQRPAATGSIVIDNNTIIDHGKTSSLPHEWQVALVIARSSNVVVSRNVIVNSFFDAISIENPSEEKKRYVIRNVSLIDNTVRGSRGADLFLTASGTFVSKGNRFYHGSSDTSNPRIRRAGQGISGRLTRESSSY